jgi:SSS family solute:Na+ symporter
LYQFFLNFGNATDANGAVSTASLVYKQGASGVWHALQTLFMNPYYWFMNLWFRRVRLVTVADLFEDRFGSRGLAQFYAAFQIVATVTVIIGFGNLISYKVTSSLLLKDQRRRWTADERRSAEGYQRIQAARGRRGRPRRWRPRGGSASRVLRRPGHKRGELRSYISWLHSDAGKWALLSPLHTDRRRLHRHGRPRRDRTQRSVPGRADRGVFGDPDSLRPGRHRRLARAAGEGARAPAPDRRLGNPAPGTLQVTFWTLLAILFVSIVQIHGIIGNMTVSGSARDEFAARFGAVSGTYAKRIMIILWALCGLIAVALFAGPRALSDPDAAWGTMSLLQLLPPGDAGPHDGGPAGGQHVDRRGPDHGGVGALHAQPLQVPCGPGRPTRDLVRAGRRAIVVILAIGVIAAANMEDVFTQIQLMLTVQVPFGAAVMLMFFWRRLTAEGRLGRRDRLLTLLNIVAPKVAENVDAWRTQPGAWWRRRDEGGVKTPVFWDAVVHQRPGDLASPLEGRGRLHLELVRARSQLGLDLAAARREHAVCGAVLLRRAVPVRGPPAGEPGHAASAPPAVVDLFYGKMKTPVNPVPEKDAAAMAETQPESGVASTTGSSSRGRRGSSRSGTGRIPIGFLDLLRGVGPDLRVVCPAARGGEVRGGLLPPLPIPHRRFDSGRCRGGFIETAPE